MESERAESEAASFWAEQARGEFLSILSKTEEVLGAAQLTSEDIHRARRLFKRANALALLLEGTVGYQAKRAGRDIRALRRQLGAARNLDVIGKALADFVPALPQASARMLKASLGRARRAHDDQGLAPDGAALRRELKWLSSESVRWRLSGAEDGGGLLATLVASYRRARRRGAVAFAAPIASGLQEAAQQQAFALHEFRKALIVHREQALVFAGVWPKLINGWCAEAQALREALGRLNDLAMVADFARTAAPQAALAMLDLHIDQARREALAEAQPAYRRLFYERPKDFSRRLHVWLADPKKLPQGEAAPAAHTEAA